MTQHDAQALVISDLTAGSAYLAKVPLTSPAIAQKRLLRMLEAMIAVPPKVGDFLPLLEQLRHPLLEIVETMAHRHHNKALPLAEVEELGLAEIFQVWQKLGEAYACCAARELPAPDAPRYQAVLATVLHRQLFARLMLIVEHYGARRELPEGTWSHLHVLFRQAEAAGVLTQPVADQARNAQQNTSCLAVYVLALLLDIASPYSNSVRHQQLMRRWAELWAPLVSVLPAVNEAALPAYCIDLDRDLPLQPTAAGTPGASLRFLAIDALAARLEEALAQLAKRVKPSQLGLGDELSGTVTQLLTQLRKPWSLQASPRKYRRFQTEGTAQVASSFATMHFHISKLPFVQPDSARAYSRNDYNQLFTFRDRVAPAKPVPTENHPDFAVDEWQVINHSANGFRLARGRLGDKIGYAQLIAIRPHDGTEYLLARVSWLMQEKDMALIAGVAVLPNLPVPIGIRAQDSGERYVPAFWLPPSVHGNEAGSLVLPLGLYQPLGVMDLFTPKETLQFRLRHVLERGLDYERISYEVA